MKPSIGRTVITKGVVTSNGTDEHPAIVNRVWSDADPADPSGQPVCVNLTVFPDFMTPQHAGSVYMFETRTAAIAAREAGTYGGPVAYWPDRV